MSCVVAAFQGVVGPFNQALPWIHSRVAIKGGFDQKVSVVGKNLYS